MNELLARGQMGWRIRRRRVGTNDEIQRQLLVAAGAQVELDESRPAKGRTVTTSE